MFVYKINNNSINVLDSVKNVKFRYLYHVSIYFFFLSYRLRVEHMERQLANLTGLVQKALTQTVPTPSPRERDLSISSGKRLFYFLVILM